MAGKSQGCDVNMFEILSNISSPLKESAVNPDVSESYPTAILDDSCVTEVTIKPSIPLVESIEAFALGLIETPFGNCSVKPNGDVPLIKQENHILRPVKVENAESHGFFAGSSHNQSVQSDAYEATADSKTSPNNPQLTLLNEQLPVAGSEQLRTLSAK